MVEEVNGVSMTRLWPHEINGPLPHIDYDRLMSEPGGGPSGLECPGSRRAPS